MLITLQSLARLKTKKNGGKRLLICYMSIGEAEDYRWYWQEIIYGTDGYLSKILNAGFDGVYLDIIDAFEYFEEK